MAWGRRSVEPPEGWEDDVAGWLIHFDALDADERALLGEIIGDLLGRKRWEAARGFTLTDEMRLTIAAQAALLALGLDADCYHEVRAIIVHPTTRVLTGPRPGPAAGVVVDGPFPVIGQAHGRRGPVIIAWDAVRRDLRHPERGHNVVFHEFAHKLDMLDGIIDGTPPLADQATLDRWIAVCTAAYEALRRGEGGLLRGLRAGRTPASSSPSPPRSSSPSPSSSRPRSRTSTRCCPASTARTRRPASPGRPRAEPAGCAATRSGPMPRRSGPRHRTAVELRSPPRWSMSSTCKPASPSAVRPRSSRPGRRSRRCRGGIAVLLTPRTPRRRSANASVADIDATQERVRADDQHPSLAGRCVDVGTHAGLLSHVRARWISMPSSSRAVRASGIRFSQQMSVPMRPSSVSTPCSDEDRRPDPIPSHSPPVGISLQVPVQERSVGTDRGGRC